MLVKDGAGGILLSQKLWSGSSIELWCGESIKFLCPVSFGRTAAPIAVHIEVNDVGKLIIKGGSSIIAEIAGEGMKEKVKD